MSKGSRQRPLKVSKEQMEENWNRIFGKKDEQKKDTNSGNPKKRSRPCPDVGSKA